jgi:hypothetical protein
VTNSQATIDSIIRIALIALILVIAYDLLIVWLDEITEQV